MTRARHVPAAVSGALLCLLAACAQSAPRPAPKHGVCELPLPEDHGRTRPLRPSDWLGLLLVEDARRDLRMAGSLCTGERIEHTPLPADCEVQTTDPGVPEPVPLTEASVVERMLPDNRRLIWIMTHRFPNGDGFGPIAAVTLGEHSVYVGSLGLLRLRPERVDLNLWEIGGKVVLMAAGESCTDPQNLSTCRRAANILVFDGDHFRAVPIRRAGTHDCIDAPWVEYKREADLTLDSGWNRHMRIVASLDHDQRYVVITEQVDVTDSDPEHPDVPSRDVRRVDGQRFVHVEGAELFSRQPPLWPRIIPSQGNTQVTQTAQP
jgi:hypothetical protein